MKRVISSKLIIFVSAVLITLFSLQGIADNFNLTIEQDQMKKALGSLEMYRGSCRDREVQQALVILEMTEKGVMEDQIVSTHAINENREKFLKAGFLDFLFRGKANKQQELRDLSLEAKTAAETELDRSYKSAFDTYRPVHATLRARVVADEILQNLLAFETVRFQAQMQRNPANEGIIKGVLMQHLVVFSVLEKERTFISTAKSRILKACSIDLASNLK